MHTDVDVDDFRLPSLEQLAERTLDPSDRVRQLHPNGRNPPIDDGDGADALVDEMLADTRAFTDAELDAEPTPHPHVFQDGGQGLFPIEEAAVVCSLQRAGKSKGLLGVAVRGALGRGLGRFVPKEAFATVVFTAEDSRTQVLEDFRAQVHAYSKADRRAACENVRVLDLQQKKYAPIRNLVVADHGQPLRNFQAVDHFCRLLARLRQELKPPLRMVIFETASRINDADEGNTALSYLAELLQEVARRSGVAVVLSHHISQASRSNLGTLEIDTDAFRGGSALVANTRQSWLAVNLGGGKIKFKDSDARTLLRRQVNAEDARDLERVTAFICLDSSRCEDPSPFFMRWLHGTQQTPVDLPLHLANLSWSELQAQIGQAKADQREAAQEEKFGVEVKRVTAVAARLHEAGQQPTASRVSQAAGMGKSGATKFLLRAVQLGLLVAVNEQVPRAGWSDVYRPRAAE